jgi:hypothetical protein
VNTRIQKKIIIIVSAYSSGAALAPLFIGRGYSCIHITTRSEWENENLNTYYQEADFIKNIILDDNEPIQKILTSLKKYDVKLILAGSEPGVTLADHLSEHFDVPKNDFKLSPARRNKFLMIDAVKNYGITHANQIKSGNLNDILQWVKESVYKKTVLKPLSSSASDSVFYCRTYEEIENAFHVIINNKDRYAKINKEVLAQELIDGDEYIVNTVSRDGLHFIVDIWKGVSMDKEIVSSDSYADLIYPHSDEFIKLSDYTKKVLNALGIKNGPAHSEVRISSRGPCLIETGARLAGKVDFSAIDEIYGYSQNSLTIEALLEPDVFKRRLTSTSLPKKHARYVYFSSDQEGFITNDPDFSDMLNIQSIFELNFTLKKGQQLRKTSKSLRSPRPGYCYLIADNTLQIEDDYIALRKAERELYTSMLKS